MLINLTGFMGILNWMRLLYKTCFITKSQAFLKSIHLALSLCPFPLYLFALIPFVNLHFLIWALWFSFQCPWANCALGGYQEGINLTVRDKTGRLYAYFWPPQSLYTCRSVQTTFICIYVSLLLFYLQTPQRHTQSNGGESWHDKINNHNNK